MTLFRKTLAQLMREAESILDAAPRPMTAGQIAARGISLKDFVKTCWHVIEPDTRLAWS